MTGKKRKSFSLNEKQSILEVYETKPKMSQQDAAARLAVPQATSCRLLTQRQTYKVNSEAVHFITLYSCSKYTNVN